jgi:exodeoxyribonuclease VII small subunit
MAKNAQDLPIDYSAASARLDEIVSSLQSNGIEVEKALELYKEGMTLVRQIERYLEEAEHTITKLSIKQ